LALLLNNIWHSGFGAQTHFLNYELLRLLKSGQPSPYFNPNIIKNQDYFVGISKVFGGHFELNHSKYGQHPSHFQIMV
jgi:hypothetical protein